MELADDLYERRIDMASDCKVIVKDIHQKNPTVYGAIIHEIIHRKNTFITYNIIHELRSSNSEAHKLVKHALSLGAGRYV